MSDKHPMQAAGNGAGPGGDGVSDTDKAESRGGAWPGKNDKPADPDAGVVTHDVRGDQPARDDDGR